MNTFRASVDISRVIKGLNKINSSSRKVVDKTVSDMKSRAPAWVSQVIRKEYNIKRTDSVINRGLSIHTTGIFGTVNIGGTYVSNVVLDYKDHLLTHTHFGMKPEKRPAKNAYKITATVKRGNKRTLHGKSRYSGMPFLVKTSKKKESAPEIVFQRKGKNPYPIMKITTISVPQMISTGRPENVKPEVMDLLREKINGRFEQHLKTFKKQNGLL